MTKLKPGDRVICRIKNNKVLNSYDYNYDELRTFDIVAVNSFGYYLYIPPYMSIKDTIKVDNNLIKQLDLDKKYLNDLFLYITDGLIYKIKSQLDGCACIKCKEFYYQAVPNQEDGLTLICWSCRQEPVIN